VFGVFLIKFGGNVIIKSILLTNMGYCVPFAIKYESSCIIVVTCGLIGT